MTKTSRRQGVGRQLLRYAEGWAAARRVESIELNVWARNTAALAFYEALGFEPLRLELLRDVGSP